MWACGGRAPRAMRVRGRPVVGRGRVRIAGTHSVAAVVRGCWSGGTGGGGGLGISGPIPRDASEGKGPQRRPQKRLGRRLEEVAKAFGGGYCRLQMPLRLAFGVRGTVAGHRLGALEGGGGGGAPV